MTLHTQTRDKISAIIQTTDTIIIRDLIVFAIIGFYPNERAGPQKLILNLKLFLPDNAPRIRDNLEDVIDYEHVCNTCLDFIKSSEFYLIETLADKLCEKLLENYPLFGVCLILDKPGAIENAGSVAIEVQRLKNR